MASGDFFIDGIKALEGGANSGVVPVLLPPNQVHMATNATFRGGFITHRPPIRKMNLTFESDAMRLLATQSYFQGASFYQPDTGDCQLVASIGGRIFVFTPDKNDNATVVDITIPGDANPPNAVQVWMWQSERWLIINDGQSLPLIWDGVELRRSLGPSQVVATTNGWVAPAVGSTVTGITLSAPYTGQLGIPVLVIRPTGDAATYIVKRNGPSVNNATLKKVIDIFPARSDTDRAAVAAGEKVFAIPSRVGSIAETRYNLVNTGGFI